MHFKKLEPLFNSRKKYILQIIIACVSMVLAGMAWSASDKCLTHQTNNTFAKLEVCLTLENLVGHLKELQHHADMNTTIPGTRFMGTSGYEASKKYIINKLETAGYDVMLQTVPVTLTYITKPRIFEQISPSKKIFSDDIDYAPFVGSGEGEVTANVQMPINSIGCFSTDFVNFTKGNIALLSMGQCTTSTKINNAAAAGAKAVIIANNNPGIFYIGFTPTPIDNMPSLFVSAEVGKMLRDTIMLGTFPQIHIKFNAIQMKTMSENIIAESREGDANHVVMVGAHLDSSAGNAGINDNGSAAAAVLEIALLMQDIKPVNTLRFAWWTGEELGLLGSTYYMTHLNNSEKAKIALYLNYEILGAPNGARLIMGTKLGVTSPGSEKITETYVNYFKQQGLKYFVFDPSMGDAGKRSDMRAFMEAGIPVGYLVSGADIPWNPLLSDIFTDLPNRTNGLAMHPCYHKLCDKLTMIDNSISDPNFDFDLYLQMSKAAAFAIYSYAMNTNN